MSLGFGKRLGLSYHMELEVLSSHHTFLSLVNDEKGMGISSDLHNHCRFLGLIL